MKLYFHLLLVKVIAFVDLYFRIHFGCLICTWIPDLPIIGSNNYISSQLLFPLHCVFSTQPAYSHPFPASCMFSYVNLLPFVFLFIVFTWLIFLLRTCLCHCDHVTWPTDASFYLCMFIKSLIILYIFTLLYALRLSLFSPSFVLFLAYFCSSTIYSIIGHC